MSLEELKESERNDVCERASLAGLNENDGNGPLDSRFHTFRLHNQFFLAQTVFRFTSLLE